MEPAIDKSTGSSSRKRVSVASPTVAPANVTTVRCVQDIRGKKAWGII